MFETVEFTIEIEEKDYSVVVEYVENYQVDFSGHPERNESDVTTYREIVDLILYDQAFNDVTRESEDIIQEHLTDDVLWREIEAYQDMQKDLCFMENNWGTQVINPNTYNLADYED